jgi:hypothetical protein
MERSISLASTPGGSLPSPALQPDDTPIKCWEIGPGTAVQDAVAHIVKLASQAAQPSRPHSPAGRLMRGGSGSGGMPGTGAMTDDSRSEISHDLDDGDAATDLPGQGRLGAAPQRASPTLTAAGAGQPPAARQALQAASASAQQYQQQQQQQQQGQGSPRSSEASTPQRPVLPRRPLLARPSLDQVSSLSLPRSPTHPADSGSTLRSFALR